EAVVRGDRQRHGRVDARQLLDADAVVDARERRAAVVLGKLDAEETERGELRDELAWKMLRLVPLADVRPNLGFGEPAHAPAQQLLVLGEPEVHRIKFTGAYFRTGPQPPSAMPPSAEPPAARAGAGDTLQSVCGARFSTSQPRSRPV